MKKLENEETLPKNYEKIAREYRKLDERLKKKIFSKLAGQNSKLFVMLQKEAGLAIGGIRTTTIVERPEAYRKKIDDYLQGEAGLELLDVILASYFTECRKDLIDDYEDFRSSRVQSLQSLEEYRLRLKEKGEPLADLFAAMIEGSFRMVKIPRLPEQLSPLVEALESLNQKSNILGSAAEKMRAAIPLDVEDLKKTLEGGQNSILEVRKKLEELAAPFGLMELKWEDRRELYSVIEDIAEKIWNSQNIDSRVSEFIEGLAVIICNLEIVHRSEKKIRLIDTLREEVVTELQARASNPPFRPIPGADSHKEPRLWLEWSLTLAGDDLDVHQSNLRESNYIKLSEFIGETDLPSLSFPSFDPSSHAEAEAKDEEPPKPSESSKLKATKPEEEQVTSPEEKGEDSKWVAVSAPLMEIEGTPTISESAAPPVKEEVVPAKTSSVSKQPDEDEFVGLLEMDPQGLAKDLVKTLPDIPGESILGLAWNLVRADRLSYAFHLSGSAQQSTNAGLLVPSPLVLEMVMYSRHIDYAQTPLIQRMQILAAQFSADSLIGNGHPTWSRSNRLLLASACMRASVFAPVTGTDHILKLLPLGDLSVVYDLMNEIVSFAEKHLVVAPEFLAKSITRDEWSRKKKAFITSISQWWEASLHYNTNFAPATRIWQQWLKPGQIIFDLIKPILDGNEERYESQPTLNNVNWDKLIERTNQKALKRNQAIEGQARKMLIRRGEESIDLAKQWVKLLSSKPEREESYREPIQQLIRAFDRLGSDSLSFLDSIGRDSRQCLGIRTGAGFIKEAISEVHAILKGTRVLPSTIWDPNLIVNRDMLLSTDIRLNGRWDLDPGGIELRNRIISSIAYDNYSLEKAFHRHCETGDHLASLRIIDLIRQVAGQPELIERLERQRDESRRFHLEALRELIGQTRLQLSDSLAKGLMAEAEFLNSSDYIEKIDRILADDKLADEFVDYRLEAESLRSLQTSLYKENEKATEKMRVRLSSIQATEEQKGRIAEALNKGDIHLATDFMDRLENGLPLPEEALPADVNVFADFFGLQGGANPVKGHFAELNSWLNDSSRHDGMIPNYVAKQTNFAGLDIKHVPGSQLRQYASTLETWFTIKRQRKLEKADKIRPVLTGLGFNILDLDISPYGDKTWLKLKAEPVTNSPIAHYGSEARGKYNILLNFSLTNEEDLIASFDNLPRGNRGDAVFYFGRLSEKQRRSIARLCVKNKRTVIVIDDFIMIYLASVRGAKIPALLSCTLPFTYFMPYLTMASILPPEMFFGRSREIAALETMSASEGSCFVYGGRQIGKTVLLKQVQRRVHRPDEGKVAKYIDLKLHGFGQNKPPEDIWGFLTEEIKAETEDCFPETIPSKVKFDWFANHIKKWLQDESPDRRILLLLDEADTFLAADAGKDYPLCQEFKGLMEETNLNFKMIFAGLHNVQRSTRASNNPLAHLGTPICVGPLLQGGEAREAQALIQMPLAAAGIFFESTDLIIRILAQANYYPNLIQIYCQNLLQHVIDTYGHPGTAAIPPYVVTSSDIQDVYERQQLRDDLRQRFRLTLDLDPRFNLIAHILALYYDDYVQGFESNWIHRNALEWWPAGFQESQEVDSGSPRMISFDSFQYLLDEMSGLGILRKIESDKYNLRSPNVVSLLGSKIQIERVLDEFSNREGQWSYSPDTFRSLIDKHDNARRSPFTATQEDFFKRNEYQVAIVAGTEAAGLEDVPKALAHSFGSEFIRLTKGVDTLNAFQKSFGQLSSRKGHGKTFLVIPPDSDWRTEWVREAEDRLKNFSKKEAGIAVVFIADPVVLWKNIESLRSQQTEIITLHPWKDENVRIWLQDAQLGYENKEMRKQIFDHTGYWPLLLRILAGCSGTKQVDRDCLSKLRDKIYGSYDSMVDIGRHFGLELEGPSAVLKVLADWNGPLNSEDLIELLPPNTKGQGLEIVSSAIWWATKLDLIRLQSSGWEIDPFVQKLLAPVAK